MNVVSVKVEIPDGWDLACERMRQANFREFILEHGVVKRWTSRDESQRDYVIVSMAWVWPSWLKAAAVVRTKTGGLLGCEKVPKRDTFLHAGWANTGNTMNLTPASAKFACLHDYPNGPWEDSFRVNPNME